MDIVGLETALKAMKAKSVLENDDIHHHPPTTWVPGPGPY